jgi:hypothetical protein
MNGPRDPEACRIAERVMRYLEEHVDAADTIDGIATWWLGDMLTPALPKIERAMRTLVAEGRVQEQVLPDGRVIYRSARSGAR